MPSSLVAIQSGLTFDVREPYGKVDAVRWMAEQLEHIRPEQRARIATPPTITRAVKSEALK